MTPASTVNRPHRVLMLFAAVLVWVAGVTAVAAPANAAPGSIYCDSGPESRQPVLLVHGFHSGPQTWQDASRNQLARAGSATCIDVFDYAARSTRWVTDSEIGPALATRITALAAASAAGGGSGKVIVVAHSMGGLATRCAASETCNGGQRGVDAKLAELITFGTPNLGSWLVSDTERTLASLLSAACLLSNYVTNEICVEIRELGTSEAGRAFKPGSPPLTDLPSLPKSVPVYALAAQIELHSSFFGLNDADLGSGGDLIVLQGSALAAPQSVGTLGGEQTIDCGTFDITDWLRSTNTCWHGTETNDTRFLEAAAHQIELAEAQTARQRLTGTEVENGIIPAGLCGDGRTTGWAQPVPIQLHNGAGTARYPNGSFAGSSIDEAKVIGIVDIDRDGSSDAVLQFTCFGSTPEQCCAGRASQATFVAVLTKDAGGRLRLVGQVIEAGASLPGDQYGPAGRNIRAVTLEGTTIVTSEYLYYPEPYTAAQVGGDPTAPVSVRHVLRNGRWVSE